MSDSKARRYLTAKVGGGGQLSYLVRPGVPFRHRSLYFFSFLVDFFLEAGVWAALGGSGWAEA